jgi:high-affinity iron transporter
VLFVGGSLTGAGTTSPGSALAAGALGLVAGAGVGVVIYAGLARVPARHIFSVTNLLIALLAASLASPLARALAQAGLLELGTAPLWDTSRLLSPGSALGTFLHALAGYDARPSAVQLASYVAILLAIFAGMRLMRRKDAA